MLAAAASAVLDALEPAAGKRADSAGTQDAGAVLVAAPWLVTRMLPVTGWWVRPNRWLDSAVVPAPSAKPTAPVPASVSTTAPFDGSGGGVREPQRRMRSPRAVRKIRRATYARSARRDWRGGMAALRGLPSRLSFLRATHSSATLEL